MKLNVTDVCVHRSFKAGSSWPLSSCCSASPSSTSSKRLSLSFSTVPTLCPRCGALFLFVMTFEVSLSRLCCQRGFQDLQLGHGLLHRGDNNLELRRGGHVVHPLDRAAAAPAGLPHHDQRPHGPGLRQVPARVDRLAHIRRHIRLR